MALERERRGALAVGIAVFLAGAVLLGVEIAASRVLAPYFGNSLFVWGALIGVVLAGLATGYYLGGSLADRMPTPRLLLGVIGLSALLVLAIPFVDEWVLEQVVEWDPGPRLSPLVAAIALFGLPSIVLGSVSPIAVRLSARSLERLGRTAGSLYALSTAGSIAGTFATAFWLIPELGTDQVLAVGALALLVAAAAVAAGQGLALELAVALALTGVSVGAVVSLAPETGGRLEGAAARNWSPVYRTRAEPDPSNAADAASASESSGYDVVLAKDTRYHHLVVAEDEQTRYLRFDSSFQSAMYKDDPFATRFTYTDYLSLGLAYRPSARRVLFVGLGGGSAPKRMWRDFPNLRLQAVELDPDVVETAYRWFELPRHARLDVDTDDGRRWLTKHDERWDVIVLDAFYSDSIPFHLATREFMELVQRRLAPGGVLVTNMIGSVTGEQSKLLRSLVRTYRSVFPTVALHPVFEDGFGRDPTEIRNVIMVATESAEPTKAFLTERWNQLRRRSPEAPDLTRAIANRWERFVPTADVPILTDDYAPTDALLLVF
jgi:spermidine synthase